MNPDSARLAFERAMRYGAHYPHCPWAERQTEVPACPCGFYQARNAARMAIEARGLERLSLEVSNAGLLVVLREAVEWMDHGWPAEADARFLWMPRARAALAASQPARKGE